MPCCTSCCLPCMLFCGVGSFIIMLCIAIASQTGYYISVGINYDDKWSYITPYIAAGVNLLIAILCGICIGCSRKRTAQRGTKLVDEDSAPMATSLID